ncbi:primosome assembly protein PriA [Kordiimonas sediminis]|uniref:Primosome assembly protein PriA n=1 Tax=Kordiimonas sediminis TaxID=1735581 RepID=A0A919AP66_9PROT|nr:HK97 family phage prohead protease [Kordiimonas sediminis]GHF18111.1 primosome assembly protein PriA [Kordiimonas sediminis]
MTLTEAETVSLPLEVKTTGAIGTFEGYGAIFGNVDRDGDQILPGAFELSLKERTPVLLWQHNSQEPIGRFDTVREDARGLFVKGRLLQHGRGLEAYDLLKMGALDGLSIGFVVKEAYRHPKTGVRQIKRADCMEISLVTFPANDLARVQSVKSVAGVRTERDFERFLRLHGFSKKQSKAITSRGFRKSIAEEVEDAGLVSQMHDRLRVHRPQAH